MADRTSASAATVPTGSTPIQTQSIGTPSSDRLQAAAHRYLRSIQQLSAATERRAVVGAYRRPNNTPNIPTRRVPDRRLYG
jgi:hypothetical protein